MCTSKKIIAFYMIFNIVGQPVSIYAETNRINGSLINMSEETGLLAPIDRTTSWELPEMEYSFDEETEATKETEETKEVRETEQTEQVNANVGEDLSQREVIEGVWGDEPWTFDVSEGVLTFSGDGRSVLGGPSPWSSSNSNINPIDSGDIRHIIFEAKVTAPVYANYLFSDAKIENTLYALTTIDGLENLDTSDTLYMTRMFQGCSSLTSLDVSNFNTSTATSMILMFAGCESLTSLDVSTFDTSNVKNMSNMFQNCKSLTNLNLSSFDTSNVTNMLNMFAECKSLTSLDLSKFTTSKVTTMNSMFYKCESLENIDVSSFTTSNVTDMLNMFAECKSLTSLDLSKFTTSKVTTMNSMFYKCESLENIDVSSFTTSNVTDMLNMFAECKSLTSLDLSKFTTSKVTTMNSMFYKCESLENIDVSSFTTLNVTDMLNMFAECKSLTSLDLSKFTTSKVTTMNSMFYKCESLENIDVSSFTTSNVTDMLNMFAECKSLTSLNLSTFDTTKVTNMGNIFGFMNNLNSLTLGEKSIFTLKVNLPAIVENDTFTGNWIAKDTAKINMGDSTNFITTYNGSRPGTYVWEEVQKWGDVIWTFDYDKGTLTFSTGKTLGESATSPCNKSDAYQVPAQELTKIVFKNKVFAPEDASYLFSSSEEEQTLQSLKTIEGLTNLDTSNVTDMSNMFRQCTNLQQLDLSHFDTKKVEKMQYMFANCTNLQSLDVGKFTTSKVTTMTSMFYGCESLVNIDVTSFNTSNVTDMLNMFAECRSLTSLDLSTFDTTKVTNMTNMFGNMAKLETLTLGGKSIFISGVNLPAIVRNDTFTGNWMYTTKNNETIGTSDILIATYDGSRPGAYAWELLQDTLNPTNTNQTELTFKEVPNTFKFVSARQQGHYELTNKQLIANDLTVYNSRSSRSWGVHVSVKDDQLSLASDPSVTFPVNSFTMNQIELLGTDGIVFRSEEEKTIANNVGDLSTEIEAVSISFSDTRGVLKQTDVLTGEINYQLQMKPSFE